ncbi:DNA polymerase III subunit delta [Irregularibacter muris]|uniref:DNA polymerase III subunit delta n=1 Tax=Irregularibacter muris TaxID=1796619 RepID=A0AAE3HCH7_9FIRM|nr:DNA polymerase III subunit delta [Irregularibacter muris]MCR1897837.1 DNA polymerase III subunit delta [Irregularibacter muris]
MNYNTLIKEIKAGELHNIYLFYGQEQYLCENIIKTLKDTLIGSAFGDLNYEYMEGAGISIKGIENACETLPFMEDKRLVIVKNLIYLQGGKNPKEEEDLQSLMDYLKKVPNSTCLVFWQSQEIDKRKKLFQAIKKHGKVIEFEQLKGLALEKWLEKNIKQREKLIKKPTLQYLINQSDYLSKNSAKTLGDIENELNKIIDYIGNREEILQEDVEKILPRRLENDIFKMVDAIGKKEREIALRLLNDMLEEGENEIMILSMISRQFRILIQSKELKNRGYSPNEIASKLKMAPFIIQKGITQGQYFSIHSLKEILYSTLDIDEKIKTGKIDQRLALEMLIYQCTKKL